MQVFTPSVSATCRAGVMTIKVRGIKTEFASGTKSMLVNTFKQVETGNRFLGVVHARDYR